MSFLVHGPNCLQSYISIGTHHIFHIYIYVLQYLTTCINNMSHLACMLVRRLMGSLIQEEAEKSRKNPLVQAGVCNTLSHTITDTWTPIQPSLHSFTSFKNVHNHALYSNRHAHFFQVLVIKKSNIGCLNYGFYSVRDLCTSQYIRP